MLPFDPRSRLFSDGNHFGGAFYGDDESLRPSFGEQFGDVACPCAKVGNTSYRKIRNSHQQVHRRPQSVTGEFEVLLGIPDHRFSSSFDGPQQCYTRKPPIPTCFLPTKESLQSWI